MSKKPILILQMQRMGDLILTYPLMLWLARRYPGHPLFVAAEPSFYQPLLSISPQATYFPYERTRQLKQHDYELVINLSIRSEAASLAGQVTTGHRIGPVQAKDGSRFVHGDWQLYRASLVRNNLYNRFHWAELNALDVISFADMKGTVFSPPRTLPDSNRVGLFLGASDVSKRPDTAFWAALADSLHGRGLRPVLFGGPAEQDLGEAVTRQAKGPVLNLCGTLDLKELGAVGQTIGLFITPDTGPMHLAAWTGLKCLNLSMGNVNPWETGPFNPGHAVLRADMECAKGCWACTRDRLYCHDPFNSGRVAGLAHRMIKGDGPDKLARFDLPGLTLSGTGKSGLGLYGLPRFDKSAPDAERLASRFWQAFFGHAFGLWSGNRPKAAWQELVDGAEEAADALLDHMPEIGRQFTHGVRFGALLHQSFWEASPPMARPFTGYIQMYLQNHDYARRAWTHALGLMEQLAACQSRV